METTIRNCKACPRGVFFVWVGMRVYPDTPLHELMLRDGSLTPAQSLLEPHFYLSPALDPERLSARCAELGRLRNWLVVGEGLRVKERVAAMLRARGEKGSLWHKLTPG